MFNPFVENARAGPAQLTAVIALMNLFRPRAERAMARGNSAEYYTLVGDDVVEGKNTKFKDPEKPLWLNVGYWKTARTYPEAAADLARLLGRAAGIGAGDQVLDVGNGYAEQDLLWVRERNPAKIVGLNITPLQVERARERAAAAGLADRIELQLGSATKLSFGEAQFERVVALESALHFDTREAFFAEAFRVLKPGGTLGLLDILPSSASRAPGEWPRRQFRRRIHVPEQNLYPKAEYAAKLAAAGFGSVTLESIGDYTFPGMAKYCAGRLKGRGILDPVDLAPSDFAASRWVSAWRDYLGLDDYVLATAIRERSSR